jgi:hypothetical protein
MSTVRLLTQRHLLHLTISVKDKPYQQEQNCDDYQHWKQADEEDKYQGKCQEQDH